MEDFRISQDEDFSSNKFLFTAKKILLKFSSFYEKSPFLKKVIIYDSKITIDVNDPISDSLMEYFQNFSLSEVALKNSEIVFIQNGTILFATEKPVQINFRKEKNKVILDFSDNILPKNFFSRLYGRGEIDLDSKTYKITAKLQNFPVQKLEGLSVELIGVSPESGKINSVFEIVKDANSIKVFGRVELHEINGTLDMKKDVKIRGLAISENFHFTKNMVLVKGLSKSEFSTKREISTDYFTISLEKFLNAEKLKKIKLFVNATDLSKFSQVFSFSENLMMEGGFVLKLESTESGNENNWLKNEISLSSLGVNLKSKNSQKIDLSLSSIRLLLSEKGELSTEISGSTFGKQFTSKLNGNISFSKIKDRHGNIFFPVQSDSKVHLKFLGLALADYKPVYEDIRRWIHSDIKDRQEKMLSESYLVQSTLYKVLFEKMKLSLELIFQNLKFQDDHNNLGDWNIKADIANGQINILAIGGTNNQSSAALKAFMNTKAPYMDMKVKTGNIFWFDESIQFCGVKLYSDIVNLDFSVTASGNNFWDYMLSRRIMGSMEFRSNSILQGKLIESKISTLPFLLEKDLFSFGYEFDIYSLEGYKRKIEFKSDEYQIGGYSQIKNDAENYSFSGFYKKIPVFYTVTDTGDACIKK